MDPNAISENEKRILQAKHRVEENRVKEQKALTRRLIQEGLFLKKRILKLLTSPLEWLQPFTQSYYPKK